MLSPLTLDSSDWNFTKSQLLQFDSDGDGTEDADINVDTKANADTAVVKLHDAKESVFNRVAELNRHIALVEQGLAVTESTLKKTNERISSMEMQHKDPIILELNLQDVESKLGRIKQMIV
jgi:hypothetical protein